MTKTEAERLIRNEPGVCVGYTAYSGFHIRACLGGFEYWNELCTPPTWIYMRSLGEATYTRVKNPTLCTRSEDSPWNKR